MAKPNRFAKLVLSNGTVMQPTLQEWVTMTLAGTWAVFGGGFTSARYWKDPFGIVRLDGLVRSGALLAVITTLPQGYRPDQQMAFGCLCSAGGVAPNIGRIDVFPNGNVQEQGGRTGTGDWISMANISFRAGPN